MSPRSNHPENRHGYDPVARLLHWVVALAILGTFGLGLWMTGLPAETEAEVAQVFRSYSFHKTLGVGVFGPCRAAHRLDPDPSRPRAASPRTAGGELLAHMTHWGLWIGMLALPATGFLHHTAAPGFAPVLWPFGQTLPFIPADEALALIFRQMHELSGWLLAAFLALHVAGALKHALLDRDATLARMATGTGPPAAPAAKPRLGVVLALALWVALAVTAILTAPEPEADPFDDLPEDLFPLD